MASQEIILHNNTFFLHPEKAVFWKEKSTLLLADVHFGKISHFRKAGIALPVKGISKDFDRLTSLLDEFQPEKLLFLGDLFHSHLNKEWDLFVEWRNRFSSLEVELVIGNHDIMPSRFYSEADVKLYHNTLFVGEFGFSHRPIEKEIAGKYIFAGHVHPGIRLSGKGRQVETLPCFYFNKHQAILPAFGHFTGLYSIQPGKGDRVFAIAGKEVVEVG